MRARSRNAVIAAYLGVSLGAFGIGGHLPSGVVFCTPLREGCREDVDVGIRERRGWKAGRDFGVLWLCGSEGVALQLIRGRARGCRAVLEGSHKRNILDDLLSPFGGRGLTPDATSSTEADLRHSDQ